jgi:hypothetical protein
MKTITLRGERGRRLTIVTYRYEQEKSQNPYDASWLQCSVEVDLGQFRGAVNASFMTHDFAGFLEELEKVVNADALLATFNTMEEALSLRVELDRAGHATINGKLREVDWNGTELSFTIESDRSFLTETITELRALVTGFPPFSTS